MTRLILSFPKVTLRQFALQILQTQILQLDGGAGDGVHFLPAVFLAGGVAQYSQERHGCQILQRLRGGSARPADPSGAFSPGFRFSLYRLPGRQRRRSRSSPHNVPEGKTRNMTRASNSTTFLLTSR